MTVYEALTVALIMVLAAGTTVAIYVGMANWIGACYMVRCSECHHLTFASANQPQASCAHCRHPMLLHRCTRRSTRATGAGRQRPAAVLRTLTAPTEPC